MSLPNNNLRRVIIASFIGTTIEWYDFFLYGTAAALVFNKLFFPTIDPAAGTMAAFATYAVGFFARPLGGIVFGHFGDKIGRKSMLVTTLMLMISPLTLYSLPSSPHSRRTRLLCSVLHSFSSENRLHQLIMIKERPDAARLLAHACCCSLHSGLGCATRVLLSWKEIKFCFFISTAVSAIEF